MRRKGSVHIGKLLGNSASLAAHKTPSRKKKEEEGMRV
jgi:hypothetical protein